MENKSEDIHDQANSKVLMNLTVSFLIKQAVEKLAHSRGRSKLIEDALCYYITDNPEIQSKDGHPAALRLIEHFQHFSTRKINERSKINQQEIRREHREKEWEEFKAKDAEKDRERGGQGETDDDLFPEI